MPDTCNWKPRKETGRNKWDETVFLFRHVYGNAVGIISSEFLIRKFYEIYIYIYHKKFVVLKNTFHLYFLWML